MRAGPPERSQERDAAITAMVPFVSLSGWTVKTLVESAGTDADLLFPGGAADLVEAYVDLADRRMAEGAAGLGLDGMRVSGRVRAVIALRLEQNRGDKEAVRRAMGVLALPANAVLGARTLGRTVDAIWDAAGDESAGVSWYTKRATLAAVYGATVLYWLRDESLDDERTLGFLDRRLAGIGRVGTLRRRASDVMGRFRPA